MRSATSGCALALVLLTLLPSCGPSNAPRFDITAKGSGAANQQPLLPIQVGYVGAMIDRAQTGIVDGVIASDAGPIFRAVGVDDADFQYYLKTADGIFAAGNSDSGPLSHPVLVVPATVRAGMTWDTYADDGSVLLHFAVTSAPDPAGGGTLWTITGTAPPSTDPDTPTPSPNVQTYLEGRGLAPGVGSSAAQLVLLDEQPLAMLPRRPLDMEDPVEAASGGGRFSMIRPPGGEAILVAGGDLQQLGTAAGVACLSTDGKTVHDVAAANGAPFTSTKELRCIEAPLVDSDENGTSISQYLATEQAAGAFVGMDGTVYYFPRSPDGSPAAGNQAEITVSFGYTGVFFLPGDKGGVPNVVLKGCLGPCPEGTTGGAMTSLPFDQLFGQNKGTVLPVPWDRLGPMEEITPIRDDEGGTSLLLRTRDGMIWTSEVAGPAHVGMRLPGRLSVQAGVGGNEVLRVVTDGAVDRLHVSHGKLAVEHLADVAMDPGERAESAFVWHDAGGDRLLLFSTLYDGIALGVHGRFRRSKGTLPGEAGPMLTIAPALQVQERPAGSPSLGFTDEVLCAPEGAAPPVATGWTVKGMPALTFPQPNAPCTLVVDPDRTQGALDPGEIAGDLPGVGKVASTLSSLRMNGLHTETEFLRLGTAIFTALSRPVVASLSGDGFVTRYERLGPGGTLIAPPKVAALDDGVADRAGNGLWVATSAGLTLVGNAETAIAGTAGLFPKVAVVGGGVVAGPMQMGGSPTMVSPSGALTPLPALAADHVPIQALADGTICGVVGDVLANLVNLFCQPPSGPEKLLAPPSHMGTLGAQAMVPLADGSIFIQVLDSNVLESWLLEPATMTLTDLGNPHTTFTDDNGDTHTLDLAVASVTYAPDGSAWVTTRSFSGGQWDVLGSLDRTGIHTLELAHVGQARWQALRVSDHLIIGYGGSMAFARLPRP